MSAYVNADTRLDPEGEDLTIARTAELFAFKANVSLDAKHEEWVRDHIEPRITEAEQLSANKEMPIEMLPNIDLRDKLVKDVFKAMTGAYEKDCFFSKIWEEPGWFNKFTLHKKLLWTNNRTGDKVVCVPDGLMDGKSLRGVVIDSCHQTTGHSGLNRSIKYICRWFWWPGMANDIKDFCKSCRKCQTTKTL